MLEEKRKEYLEMMYQVIGAAMDVYNELGYGLAEPIYQECLSIACSEKGIPWEREKPLKMRFHGKELKKTYVADFVCYGDLIVEIKAVSELNNDHRAQLFNYLRITDSYAGILINFGHPKNLVTERYLYDYIKGSYEYVTKKRDFV
jgi:GxxExxY protein